MNSNQTLKMINNDDSNPKSIVDFCLLNYLSPDHILYSVGPHTYQLKNHHDPARIFILGCQGDGLQGQMEVAKLMNQVAGNVPFDFILGLGDNEYENGSSSANSKGFETHFYKIYHSNELPNLRNAPFFMLLGNHDGNYHKKSDLLKKSYLLNKVVGYVPQGKEVEKNQVLHTYLSDKHGSMNDKIELYKRDTLNLKTLQPWNMPHFYYSIIIGSVQIFCINSNSYPKDYLTMLTDGKEDITNQAWWLKKEYLKAKSNNRKIILALHHPLYTEGKRAFPDDYDSYLYFSSEDELNSLNEYLGCNTKSYNELLKNIFTAQDMAFDLVLAAHDHYLSYYNNNLDQNAHTKLRQLKVGGGGGKLQTRVSAKEHPYVGCCVEQHGFSSLTFSPTQPDKFTIDIYSVGGYHLRFDQQNHFANRLQQADAVELLRQQALIACHDYLSQLKNEERLQEENELNKKPSSGVISYLFSNAYYLMKQMRPYPLKIKEMACADNLIAYFNQVTLPDLELVLNHVVQQIDEEKLKYIFAYQKKLPEEKVVDLQFEHSFFFLLFKQMIVTPKGLGEVIRMRWQDLIDRAPKVTVQNF